MQEWCCSRQLVVYTEETEMSSEKFAFLPAEQDFLEELRTQQMAKYSLCRPYWLWSQEEGEIDPEYALLIAKQFEDLAKHMTCKIQADKIRALIPMVGATSAYQAKRDVSSLLYYRLG